MITTQSVSDIGSITTILSWMIACASGLLLSSSFSQNANWSSAVPLAPPNAAAAATRAIGSPGRWISLVSKSPIAFGSVAAPRMNSSWFVFWAAMIASSTLGEPGWKSRKKMPFLAAAMRS